MARRCRQVISFLSAEAADWRVAPWLPDILGNATREFNTTYVIDVIKSKDLAD